MTISNLSGYVKTAGSAPGDLAELFKSDFEKTAAEADKKLEIYNDIMTAFNAIPSGDNPLESENFNDIMNLIIIGKEMATTEDTDMLKSAILMQMGYSDSDNIGLMTEADKELLIELLTETLAAYTGDKASLSLKEFQEILVP